MVPFPAEFGWGVATSAYQIEGGVALGGRSPSVWDRFCETPGRILRDQTGAIACDHYHRWAEDLDLLVALGVTHYRLSLSWSRILPEGRGRVNPAGLGFYDRLVDGLVARGITPHVTLFHWDSPQALEEHYGSWRSRRMAKDFADYATVVVEQLGDRVRDWITLNEIFCFTHLGYGVNTMPPHAPGTVVTELQAVWQTCHHALLAHGLGVQAIRAASPQPCTVALVDNWQVPVPLIETAEQVRAAQLALEWCGTNGGILLPVLTGQYSDRWLERLGEAAPRIEAGDLATIAQPLDRLGFNVYTGVYVRAADNAQGFEILDFPEGYPRLNMPWLQVVPEAVYWGIRHISETLNRPDLPIWITENGCAAADQVEAGQIIDSDRIFYLRQSLRAAQRAIAEGYPLKGYFLWSLLDNFEWAWGYERRFGLVYVDYEDELRRIPKASFEWYRACIAEGRVL